MSVALITGGAGGIGAALARRCAARGDSVVIADLDADGGEHVAREVGGVFVHCDAGVLGDMRRAVDTTVQHYRGLDLVALNAGIAGGPRLDEHFNDDRYRSIVRANLDSVVYGIACTVPVMRSRGGDIVCTASLAGLTGMELDPVYTATKHGVIGLVRSLGSAHVADGIRINAVCPGFADTPIIEPIRGLLEGTNIPLLSADEVVDAFMAILQTRRSGECWFVQPGRPSEPFRFPTIPGPRALHQA